jgi:hypothetical protein
MIIVAQPRGVGLPATRSCTFRSLLPNGRIHPPSPEWVASLRYCGHSNLIRRVGDSIPNRTPLIVLPQRLIARISSWTPLQQSCEWTIRPQSPPDAKQAGRELIVRHGQSEQCGQEDAPRRPGASAKETAEHLGIVQRVENPQLARLVLRDEHRRSQRANLHMTEGSRENLHLVERWTRTRAKSAPCYRAAPERAASCSSN